MVDGRAEANRRTTAQILASSGTVQLATTSLAVEVRADHAEIESAIRGRVSRCSLKGSHVLFDREGTDEGYTGQIVLARHSQVTSHLEVVVVEVSDSLARAESIHLHKQCLLIKAAVHERLNGALGNESNVARIVKRQGRAAGVGERHTVARSSAQCWGWRESRRNRR